MGIERSAFIGAMRKVASSVCVVTTDGSEGRHGATVSAFCSVSADPPTVLVCLNANSKIASCVTGNGCFNVNVLPQGAREFAERFCGMHDEELRDRFDGIDTGHGRLPELPGSTVLECDLDNVISSGSHLIVLGRVVATKNGANAPLTYLDGCYHQVQPIAIHAEE